MTSWTPGWDSFPAPLLDFWRERHLCTLTTPYADGRPHVVPVGVAVDLEQRCAWVISRRHSVKARQLAAPAAVAVCQVDGGRWSTIEGTGVVHADPESVARAVSLYAARYQQPRPNPERVAVRIEIDRFLHSRGLS